MDLLTLRAVVCVLHVREPARRRQLEHVADVAASCHWQSSALNPDGGRAGCLNGAKPSSTPADQAYGAYRRSSHAVLRRRRGAIGGPARNELVPSTGIIKAEEALGL